MRYTLLTFIFLFLSACGSTPTTEKDAVAETTENAIPTPQGLPGSLRFVGDENAGEKVSAALAAEGMAVTADYSGRTAGFEEFCSGKADGLVMATGFAGDDAKKCRELGGDWSALSTLDGSMILYIKYIYADAFLERSDTF